MARLQDFQPVTPTSSDKLLVVQATGQGLVPYGSKLDSANPTGTGSLSLNRASSSTIGSNSTTLGNGNTASGSASCAEGTSTIASGARAHTEGESTQATGDSTHAEGLSTVASGNRAHAEGISTTASGTASHAENRGGTASGSYSHVSGYGTIANHESQFVFGEYNIADPSSQASSNKGTYIEIVGNGASTNSRSNARTLDWSGNETLAGDLTINGSNGVAQFVTLASVDGSSEKTYTIPDSIYNAYGIYILALANGFGVGGVYILKINNNGNAIVFTTLVVSSYATLTSVSRNQFKITTGNAAFYPRLTRIA